MAVGYAGNGDKPSVQIEDVGCNNFMFLFFGCLEGLISHWLPPEIKVLSPTRLILKKFFNQP